MQRTLFQCLRAGIVSLFLIGSTTHAMSTNPQTEAPDLQGHWVIQEEMCHLLCAFTLKNDFEGNNNRMWLRFEKGTWSEKASGPFTHVEDNTYQLFAGGKKILFELYRNALHSQNGSVYKRVSVDAS